MKTATIQLRVSPEEKEAFEGAADIAGIALSAWIRERLRHAAIRELEGAGARIPFVKPLSLGGGDA